MAELRREQIDRTCRTCMRNSEENEISSKTYQLHSIYDFLDDYENKTIQIIELLSTTVPKLPTIEIMDALPKKICSYCLDKLSAYYEFQNCCINSDLQLRNSLETDELKHNLLDPLQCAVEIKQVDIKQEFLVEVQPNSILQVEEGEDEVHKKSIEKPEEHVKLEVFLDDNQVEHRNLHELTNENVAKEESVWRCEVCSLCFLHKSHLMLHFKQNFNGCKGIGEKVTLERYYCEYCDATFTQKRNLKRHTLNKHKIDAITTASDPNKPKKSLNKIESQSVPHNESSISEIKHLIKSEREAVHCLKQNFSIPRQNDEILEKNLNTETNQQADTIIIVNGNPNSNDAVNVDKSVLESGIKNFEMWQCKICTNLFYHRKNLSRHMKTVHNEELAKDTQAVNGVENFKRLPAIYKCDLCDRVFHKVSSLYLHKHHHQYPGASKTCQYCNKTFKKLDKLKDHERTHRNEKPFLCSDCGKTFSSSVNLAQHRLRHSEERRYQCPHCPKKFFAPSDMLGHIRQVHNTKKPFVCEICGAAFKRPSCLKIHMTIHTGDKKFKCDYCDKRFPAKEHMQRHRRSHTGEKPFECKYCPRSYKSPSDLRKHLRIHLGEKSFLCDLCPAAFRLARELQTHFASHRHDDEETKARNKKAWLVAQQQLNIKLNEQSTKLEENTTSE